MFPRLVLAATVLTAFAAPVARAEAVTRLVPARGSTLVLEGSSNVKAWRCTGSTIDAVMEVAAPLDRINNIIDRIEDGNVAALMATP